MVKAKATVRLAWCHVRDGVKATIRCDLCERMVKEAVVVHGWDTVALKSTKHRRTVCERCLAELVGLKLPGYRFTRHRKKSIDEL